MLRCGFTAEELRAMVTTNPLRLLGGRPGMAAQQ
jgi:hypothetical protein